MKLASLILVCSLLFFSGKKPLKPDAKYSLKIDEPSDICYDAIGKGFFIVSDNGALFRTDIKGEIVQTAKFKGADFEGVWADEKYVYVVDESLRMVHLFDIYELTLQQSKQYKYHGGRNRGWESICWNATRKTYVFLTEKQPVLLFELDENLELKNRMDVPQFREISAATAFGDYLYFLGDEDRTIFRVNPKNYEILETWIVPILNPEGICFTPNGNCYILSDDLEKLYLFNALPE